MGPYHTLRLVLGDQLNPHHSWFRQVDPGVLYVLMEVGSEQTYVWQHIRKVQLFFAAMRAFAAEREREGHTVHYLRLTDPANRQQLDLNCRALLQQHGIRRFGYQQPDEFRLDALLHTLAEELRAEGLAVEAADTEHFLTTRGELGALFRGKKQWLMERFYRHMRTTHRILLDGDQPAGGSWNYDEQNRNPPPGRGHHIATRPRFAHHADDIPAELAQLGIHTLGQPLPPHHSEYPITRADALAVLAHFVREHLPHFGHYQDSMRHDAPLLHHSLLSFPLNVKLISPLEVIQAVEDAYQAQPDRYPLPAVEGYIRQILGWREYMRGIYWSQGEAYAQTNALQAQTPLPGWYWTGETRMRCLATVLLQSLHSGYAHHIQRLMVAGNFAALIGSRPAEINAWFLGIYVDAIEWVQLPNTHGMSQWADGGLVATKPYISGAAYINRMSDYCKGCYYDPRVRTGPRACPFNSLYWHFLARHEDRLGGNLRLKMMYANWHKQSSSDRKALLQQADTYLEEIDNL